MAPQTSSTLKVYAGKWKIFENWCIVKDLKPFKATISQLIFYFSCSMRRSYPSNPSKVTEWPFQDQSNLPLDLMWDKTHYFSIYSSHFLRERPGTLLAWDFSFVLFSLVKHPFEPISETPLKLLTLKTVFLTLLVSGSRRREIHAKAYSTVTHAPNWT